MHLVVRIPFYQFHIDIGWFKPMFNCFFRCVFAKMLTTKDIKVRVSGLIAKVARDVRSLNQLHQGVTGLVARAEMLDHGFPIGFHIDFLYQVVGEPMNVAVCPDEEFITGPRIHDQMTAPHLFL